ncbi:MAG: hypothetical protein K0R46_2925, partial [Herbinix sp.]|nr:hypothetical protein [Herbinix sp.]
MIMRKCEEFKLGISRLTTRRCLGAVAFMIIIYAIICYVIIDNSVDTKESTLVSANQSEERIELQAVEEIPADIPVPYKEGYADWECGNYYSNISLEAMEDYLQVLSREGWTNLQGEKVSVEAKAGTTFYQLTKEDRILQLITYLQEEELPMCNGILLRVDREVSLEEVLNRNKEIDQSKMLNRIQTVVDQKVQEKVIPSARQRILGLFEIYIKEAYEKLQLQAFAAISDRGYTGCFLVRKGVISYVKGSLDNALIVDIDQDGSFELVDLYSTWEAGLFKYDLLAYEYQTPILFSSLTEIPIMKYSNCFVPEGDYEELTLVKKGEEVRLLGEYVDYGTVTVQGQTLVLEDMEHFPYTRWATSYDQSFLFGIEKVIPKNPPDINISIQGIGLDYTVRETAWDGKAAQYTTSEALEEILAKETFLPTIEVRAFGSEDKNKTVVIDFGNSIPDSIHVTDAILDDGGKPLYGDKSIMNETVKILDDSKVSFELKQHMALYLSSNLEDYEKDWRRLFRVVCRFGEKECVYAFLINTGKEQQLTEITDHDFLECEDTYSMLSSSWGLGISIDTKKLPKRYSIEWQVGDGMIREWNDSTKKPIGITAQHNGYPATYSWDDNHGAILWNPTSFDKTVTVRAVIYEEEEKAPIAYADLVLTNEAGGYR